MKPQSDVTPQASGSWPMPVRFIHWLMALLILLQWPLGYFATHMERNELRADLLNLHRSAGILLLGLILLRLFIRWRSQRPPVVSATPSWNRIASRLGHFLLYLLMIAMPMTGWWVASTSSRSWEFWWLFEWPRFVPADKAMHQLAEQWHEWLGWTMLALVVVHLLAALLHHFHWRDNVLQRMWKGR